jgi:beta-glucanase (GH16 family)
LESGKVTWSSNGAVVATAIYPKIKGETQFYFAMMIYGGNNIGKSIKILK